MYLKGNLSLLLTEIGPNLALMDIPYSKILTKEESVSTLYTQDSYTSVNSFINRRVQY